MAADAAETNRWMFWFGLPALFAALSIGLALGTGWLWPIGFAIFFIVTDILVLVWLAMSSDTNSGDDSHLSH
jgi:membrane protein implicated in regulation of membrane protease activity